MLVGGRLQAQRYKLPLYRRSSLFRMLSYAAMVVATYAIPALPASAVIGVILLCYACYNLAGGTGSLAFQDVVAKAIPPQRRGAFFGYRQLVGGLLAFLLAGPLVQVLVSASGPLRFPLNYGLLATLSLICVCVGLSCFMLIEEPPQERTGPVLSLIEGLRRAPALLRDDSDYRWFTAVRLLPGMGQIGEPFYIIYAIEVLGVPAAMVGVYLATRALSAALSNIYWGRVSDRQGNRRLMLLTGALLVCAPAVAIVGPWLAELLGLGAAGVAVTKMMLASGVRNVVGCDRRGAIAVSWLQDKEMTSIKRWSPPKPSDKADSQPEDPESADSPVEKQLAERPIFTPGAVLATRMQPQHPLTLGLTAPPAVLVEGTTVLKPAGDPRQDVLLAVDESPVLAGFAWPEAEDRLSGSLLVGMEERGQGSVVLFAQDPTYRLFWRGTTPILLNTLIYGPSAGVGGRF